MDLFEWEEPWQVYVLENLLIAKKLFDRGFEDARRLDVETGNFTLVAQILFGFDNVKDEPFTPDINPEQKLIMEEEAIDEVSEEKAGNLREFVEFFYHHRLEVRIPRLNLLWPSQVKKIEQGIKAVAYTLEEWAQETEYTESYPYSILLAGAGWLSDEGEKVGVWFHTVSNDYDDGGPCYERSANELLLKVWDSVRVARAFRLRRKSPFRRLILFSGGNGDGKARHRETILWIKGDAGIKARLRLRNRALARDSGRDHVA